MWPDGSPLEVKVADLPRLTAAGVKRYLDAAGRLVRRQGWETRRPTAGGIFDREADWKGEPPPGYGLADADLVAHALVRIPGWLEPKV